MIWDSLIGPRDWGNQLEVDDTGLGGKRGAILRTSQNAISFALFDIFS